MERKSRIRKDNITEIDGTIYRDYAYEKINDYIYRRVDLASYDKATYKESSIINNVLVVERKNTTEIGEKYDLCVSDKPVKSEYEDPDLFMWDCYTFVFRGEYEDVRMFVKIIEREINGQLVHRILESTIDAEQYIIKVVQFKEPFESGVVNLDKYSFDNYDKKLQYAGEIVEGKWNAGDIHATKKNVDPLSTDYTGQDYDYAGSLTADGKTKLRDNVEIINDYDSGDIKPVKSVEITTESETETITKELNINVGNKENNGNVNISTFANTEIRNNGNVEIRNVGDVSVVSDSNVDIDRQGKIAVKNTGDVKISSNGNIDIELNDDIYEEFRKRTIRGASEASMLQKEDDPRLDADWNNVIIENTQIGTEEESRDLFVYGNIGYDGALELKVEENRLLFYQNRNLKPIAKSFAGDKSRWAFKEVDDGSLVYLPDWNGESELIDVSDYIQEFNPTAKEADLGVEFNNYAENLVWEIDGQVLRVSGTIKYYNHGKDWTDGYFLPLQISNLWKFAIVKGGANIAEYEGMPLDLRDDNVIIRKLDENANGFTTDLMIRLYETSLPDDVELYKATEWNNKGGFVLAVDVSGLVKEEITPDSNEEDDEEPKEE